MNKQIVDNEHALKVSYVEKQIFNETEKLEFLTLKLSELENSNDSEILEIEQFNLKVKTTNSLIDESVKNEQKFVKSIKDLQNKFDSSKNVLDLKTKKINRLKFFTGAFLPVDTFLEIAENMGYLLKEEMSADFTKCQIFEDESLNLTVKPKFTENKDDETILSHLSLSFDIHKSQSPNLPAVKNYFNQTANDEEALKKILKSSLNEIKDLKNSLNTIKRNSKIDKKTGVIKFNSRIAVNVEHEETKNQREIRQYKNQIDLTKNSIETYQSELTDLKESENKE